MKKSNQIMTKYKLINNISGWAVFAIAATVYLLTIEPTASFWDCGEFITQAFKMEIGHQPGAPVFMLVANFFSQLAQDPTRVAMMVNSMSALMSAFTILFLFWTITHLTRKLVLKQGSTQLTLGQTIAVIGSGLVGALVYTFSDTFWFSAVEGEVYAFSSMLTASYSGSSLNGKTAHQPHSDKWLVLIAYIMGLSIGFTCSTCFVSRDRAGILFQEKRYPTWKGTILSLLVSLHLSLY